MKLGGWIVGLGYSLINTTLKANLDSLRKEKKKKKSRRCAGEGDGMKGPKEFHQQVMRGCSNLGRAPRFFLIFTIETIRSLAGAARFLRAPCLSWQILRYVGSRWRANNGWIGIISWWMDVSAWMFIGVRSCLERRHLRFPGRIWRWWRSKSGGRWTNWVWSNWHIRQWWCWWTIC